MEKKYDHKIQEPEIQKKWEEKGIFTGKIDKNKKPFTIVLPPPNANGKLHTGHVLMLAIEDILIRWKKMQGYSTLWVPGTDHAGFETQVVFERHLKEKGKSRFDYDRDSLYKEIWDFVQENKGVIESQIKSMGPGLDWTRYTFTLDDKVVDTVYETFQRMVEEGMVYRDDYIVNYCPKCGTTFADLELRHVTRKDPLYYMKYGPFVVATTRPETKFGDTAVAVHPNDERYKEYIGKEIEVEGLNGNLKLKVIGDTFVDPKFGTGVVKVTPAHDKNDYEAGRRHSLEIKSVIGLDGKLNENTGPYVGLSVEEGRKKVVEDLQRKGLMIKIDYDYEHTVSVCYKGGHDIEPTVLPNWFIKVENFKKPALDVVINKEVKIYPRWREITYVKWMEEMRDWPISRQVVWGIRIPAWYSVEENPSIQVTFLNKKKERITGKVSDLIKKYSFSEIEEGLQSLIAPKNAKSIISKARPNGNYLQETDTFDTWFSSGHWPLVTLGYPNSDDFHYFYPTSVMETGWEIIRFWVSRMIMFGIYLTGKPPFSDVYLHGLVRAIDGKKMSKSLGNVIDPLDYVSEYGADALRMGLISGTANGKDFAFPRDKVVAYRNFANKLWNMARFILLLMENNEVVEYKEGNDKNITDVDKEIIQKLRSLIYGVNNSLEKFRFSDASDLIYQFMWHEVADNYIEYVKTREDKGVALGVLKYVFTTGLKVLHPFMPFVTEAIWSNIETNGLLIENRWPE
ncbi:valine--tRNA ligase [candidate division WWE3 bacterium]|uniref:Valine--tRNA ligase n=1 Tax=candidate division WWE3 bacterium TaxID=2053526 RepID=A0A7X9E749_UNCKA|nr:valine--tRNA ligase [candidate division WWE3 bacterium]